MWASGPVWTGAENLAPPGFDPRTVQPVGSRYTNYATHTNHEDIRKSGGTAFLTLNVSMLRSGQLDPLAALSPVKVFPVPTEK